MRAGGGRGGGSREASRLGRLVRTQSGTGGPAASAPLDPGRGAGDKGGTLPQETPPQLQEASLQQAGPHFSKV